MYFNIVSQNEEERSANMAGLMALGRAPNFDNHAIGYINERYPFMVYPNILVIISGKGPGKLFYLRRNEEQNGYNITLSEFMKMKRISIVERIGGAQDHNAVIYKDVVGIGCQLFEPQKILEIAKEIESRRSK